MNDTGLCQFHAVVFQIFQCSSPLKLTADMLSKYLFGEGRNISKSKNPIVSHSGTLEYWEHWRENPTSSAKTSQCMNAHSRVQTYIGVLLKEFHGSPPGS